jgi:uncharacterized protein (TIGR03067 family)
MPGVAFLLLLLTGCGKNDAAKVEDILKPFAGEWTVVSLDRHGKKTSGADLKDITVTVENDRLTMVEIGASQGGAGPVSVREVNTTMYALQVDPAKPAGEINFAYASGDLLGQTMEGIYELDGANLKICLANPSSPRPSQFESGETRTLMVLERKQQ